LVLKNAFKYTLNNKANYEVHEWTVRNERKIALMPIISLWSVHANYSH